MDLIYKDNVQRVNNRKSRKGRHTQYVSIKYLRDKDGFIIGVAKADKPHTIKHRRDDYTYSGKRGFLIALEKLKAKIEAKKNKK